MTWEGELFRTARKNAGVRNIPFTLTRNEFDALLVRAEGCCMISGIPFEFIYNGTASRRPYAPSLDRIDSAKGYTVANVRLVCVAVNLAMNQWGLDVLIRVARNIVEREAELKAQVTLASRGRWTTAQYASTRDWLEEKKLSATTQQRILISRKSREYCEKNGIDYMRCYDEDHHSIRWNEFPPTVIEKIMAEHFTYGGKKEVEA